MIDVQQKQQVEDALLFAAQEIGEAAYEKYISGEITQEALAEVNKSLSHWTRQSDELLKLLN